MAVTVRVPDNAKLTEMDKRQIEELINFQVYISCDEQMQKGRANKRI